MFIKKVLMNTQIKCDQLLILLKERIEVPESSLVGDEHPVLLELSCRIIFPINHRLTIILMLGFGFNHQRIQSIVHTFYLPDKFPFSKPRSPLDLRSRRCLYFI